MEIKKIDEGYCYLKNIIFHVSNSGDYSFEYEIVLSLLI